MFAPLLPDFEQAGFAKYAEMLRDVVRRRREPPGDFSDIHGLVDEQSDDADARFFGERFERNDAIVTLKQLEGSAAR
jgi:hypothetical protein